MEAGLAGRALAGLFIGAFAEEKPWVHLDIAGTAWLEHERSWETKGATGVMVRTLGELFHAIKQAIWDIKKELHHHVILEPF